MKMTKFEKGFFSSAAESSKVLSCIDVTVNTRFCYYYPLFLAVVSCLKALHAFFRISG